MTKRVTVRGGRLAGGYRNVAKKGWNPRCLTRRFRAGVFTRLLTRGFVSTALERQVGERSSLDALLGGTSGIAHNQVRFDDNILGFRSRFIRIGHKSAEHQVTNALARDVDGGQ